MSAHIGVLPAAERDIEHISASPRLFHTVHGEVRRAALRRFPYLLWLVYFD
ncbi:MAG: hypothetical protein LH471_03865 [Salinibacterium sp.]|nr:hypothetical protein [Salinibacterium sp.]